MQGPTLSPTSEAKVAMTLPSPAFPGRSLLAVCLVFFLFPAAKSAHAQSDQTWLNGSGIWDLTSPHWNRGLPWTNGNNAIFGGTGETVTVAEDVSVNHLTFNASGFTLTGSGLLGLSVGSIVDIANATHLATIDAVIQSGGITKNGSGTLVLSRANTFAGAVVVNAGALRLTHGGSLGTTAGTTTVANGARIELSGGITISGETLTINGTGGNNFGALQSISGANTWNGNVILGSSGARIGGGIGSPLTIGGEISDGGTARVLAVRGATAASETILSGVSTYGGSTDVVVGVLKLGGGNDRLPTATLLRIGNSANVEGASFDLNGWNQQIGGLTDLGALMSRTVTNTSATASTLTINKTSGSDVYAGTVTGHLGLSKTGAGSQTLSGTNTYTGTTSVGAGTLLLSGNNTLNGPINVSGGLLSLTGNNTLGGSIVIGGGTMSLAGTNTVTGPVTVNNLGILQLGNASALGATNVGTFVNSGGRVEISTSVSGQTVTVTGNGGADSYGALRTTPGVSAEWAGNVIVAAVGSRIGGGVNGTLTVSGVISGGGTAGVLFGRADNSVTILNNVNTYTGPTTLFANTGTGSRLVLGVDNAIPVTSTLNTLSALATQSMRLDLNGKVQTLAGLDSSANHAGGALLNVTTGIAGASTLTISGASSFNYSGLITDGLGTLHLIKAGTGTQRLFGNHTYTGATTVRGGTLQIGFANATAPFGSNGRLASNDLRLEGGTLRIDNLGVSNNSLDRLANTSVLTLLGGAFVYAGSDQAATNSSETVGALSFARGISPVTINYGGTNTAQFTAGDLLRSPGGGLGFINGLLLGADGTSTTSMARLFVTNPPALVGAGAPLSTGINAAAKDTGIVPYLLGVATTTTGGTGTAGTVPNTFLTYHADTGLRPLNPTDEFTTNAINAGHNTRLTAATTVSANTSINSLILEGNSFALTIPSGRTLNVASGAILFASGTEPRIDGPGTLDFGSREGIITIHSTGNTFITSPISGSGGVTYHGTGTLVLAGQQNPYSGDTVLRVANVIPQSSSLGPAGAPTSGPFGQGRLILDGSSIRATTASDISIGNELVLRGDTTIPNTIGAKNLVFTGPVTLESGDRTLTHQSSANTVFSGVIDDDGNDLALRIAGTGTGAVILSGANTYGGGTTIEGTTLLVTNTSGSGTGSGDVVVRNTGTLGGTGSIGAALTTVESGGRVSAGVPGVASGTGTLTFTGELTTATGSTWLIDIVQDQNGLSDRIDVGGALDLNGASFLPNFLGTFTNGHVYTLANYGTLTGTFDGWAEGAIISNYQISYGSGTGGAITLTAVPEPGTLAILGGALGGILWRRRRRGRDTRKRGV